jgi:hypothetical protein
LQGKKDCDLLLQFLSAVVHALSCPEQVSDDTAFTLFMALGRMIYNNPDALELLSALDLQLAPYALRSPAKLKNVVQDVELLINTPI